jgi:hypothetical protein
MFELIDKLERHGKTSLGQSSNKMVDFPEGTAKLIYKDAKQFHVLFLCQEQLT